jgi:type II secretory pathway predicted ATPase ExeA
MYQAFYHLHTDPFRATPDPAFCFRHPRYARALDDLRRAAEQGEGIVMVTGRPGTGKTTLIEQFCSELNGAGTLVVKLSSSQLHQGELLGLICRSLGVSTEVPDPVGILDRLQQFLVEQANEGRRTLLLIDEAQDLPAQALGELRLLGDLRLHARSLVRIFLVGQQQLLDMERLPAMRPLYQRLAEVCHLEPLGLDETRAYIEYRLERAGWKGPPAFDERSYRMIHRFSEGFPGQINELCSRLLLHGSTEQKHQLDCFDCLKVMKRWLEELPGATSESSVRACVDLLNAAWNAAEGDTAIEAAGTTALSRSEQQKPPPGDLQTAAEPDVASAARPQKSVLAARARSRAEDQGDATRADKGSAPVANTEAASVQDGAAPMPAADQPDTATDDAHSGSAEASPAQNTAADAAADPRPPVPVRVAPLTATPRPAAGRETRVAPSQKRKVGRAIAALGLLAALLSGLFLISGHKHDDGVAETAAVQGAPATGGGVQVVAELAPPSSSSASETVREPLNPGASSDRPGMESVAGQADLVSAQDTLPPAEPAGETVAVAPDDHEQTLQTGVGEDQNTVAVSGAVFGSDSAALPDQPPADSGITKYTPGQGTRMVAAAAGGTAATEQTEQAAERIEPGDSPARAVGSADSEMPSAADAVTVTLLPQARSGEQSEGQESVAEPGTQRASAKQQHIDDLMVSAERALRDYHLTVPPVNSAFSYYRQVLELAPQHPDARAGMQRIASRYARLIERALAADEIGRARRYIERGLRVDPGNRELLALRQDVEARAAAETRTLQAQPP